MKTKELSDHINVSLDGDSLYVKSFIIENSSYHILFFHEIGEYHESYKRFASEIQNCGLSISFVDLRGHGLSTGARGQIQSLESLERDLRYIHEYFEKKYPTQKIIIQGHGVGALIALDFFTIFPKYSALSLVNPLFKLKENSFLKLESKISKYSFLNKIKVRHGFDQDKISLNKQVISRSKNDPLINKSISLSSIKVINQLIEKSKSNIYYVTKNTYVALGNEDQLVDLSTSELFIMSIPKKTLKLKYYNGLGHEFFNEISADQFYNDYVKWIKEISQ